MEIRLKTKVAGYDGHEVTLDDGTKIATRMLIWTAGTTPSPVLASLPCALQRGRVVANEFLQVPNFPGVWALGDCAAVPDPCKPGKFYPADRAARHPPGRRAGEEHRRRHARPAAAAVQVQDARPARQPSAGAPAVAEILGMKFSGIVAWWLWRGIYLSKLPGSQKKVRVALDWTSTSFLEGHRPVAYVTVADHSGAEEAPLLQSRFHRVGGKPPS